VPLFHCYGSVIGAIAGLHAGATCVLPGAGFSPSESLEAASSEKYANF